MNYSQKISLFILVSVTCAALLDVRTIVHATEFVPPPGQPSPTEEFVDFFARQRTGLLPALIVLAGVAGSWPVIEGALHEFSRVPLEDWIWRWSLKVVLIVLGFIVGGYVYHSKNGALATAGLQLPGSACKRSQKDISTAIVLLHGWDGAADATWNNFPKLICEDTTLSDADLFVVDYPTFLVRRQLSVGELGRWLRQSFFSDTLRGYSQVHIIAHSMGGPMARSIYVDDMLAGSSKIKSIITIASPFLGAQLAGLAHELSISEDITSDMIPGSVFLKALANHWEEVPSRPVTYCFSSPQDSIVSTSSAKYQCDCTHDYSQWGHIDMVKPTLSTDERYRMPIRALRNIRIGAQVSSAMRPRCFDLADASPAIQRALQ